MATDDERLGEPQSIDHDLVSRLVSGQPEAPIERPAPIGPASTAMREQRGGSLTIPYDAPVLHARAPGLPALPGYMLVAVTSLAAPLALIVVWRWAGLLVGFGSVGCAVMLVSGLAGCATRTRGMTVGFLAALCSVIPSIGFLTILFAVGAAFNFGAKPGDMATSASILFGVALLLGVMVGGLSLVAHTVGQQVSGRGLSSVHTTCQHCGYDLIGLGRTGICPECGRAFDVLASDRARERN